MGVEAAHFMEEVGSDVFALEALAAHMGQPRPVPPGVRARPALEAEALVARAIWTATSRHPVRTGRLVEAGVMRIHIRVCIFVNIHYIINNSVYSLFQADGCVLNIRIHFNMNVLCISIY